MNLEGKLLGNRYVIIERIGGGGMAVVYKARCTLLQRFVAVKVLRTEFTSDAEIVARFKAESLSAAKLSHPNIVSIFDVGEEEGLLYIVMEYVNGVTLKQLIERNGRLRWDEAIDYSIQIAAALEQSHRNGLIHRDIKPHNIIINDEGIAKVTDFGIARAANTSSTLTNIGNAIGSVHYFSPEQARGEYVDEKSDLYSLGITMYEMVTGNVPFNSDSPISIALMHINEPVKPAKEVIPTIPVGVNQLIMKAIRKDPRLRYQSAREIIDDIRLIMANPDEAIEDEPPIEKTKRFAGTAERLPKGKTSEKKEKMKEEKKSSLKSNLILFSSVIGGGILLMVIFFLIISSNLPGLDKKQEFKVENFKNLRVEEVKERIPSWVEVKETPRSDDKAAPGLIIGQNPAIGQSIIEGSGIALELIVSSGPVTAKVPEFTNVNTTLYCEQLTGLGLTYEVIKKYDPQVPTEYIVKVEPVPGSDLQLGSKVVIYESKGPEKPKILVPYLIGQEYADAIKIIQSLNLKLGSVTPDGTSIDSYKVYTQSPKAGTEVKKGSSINLTLDPYNYVNYKLDLRFDGFQFPLMLMVEVVPSDTNIPTQLKVGTYTKRDFPMDITGIKVPVNGTTTLNIYVNNELYKTEILQP